MCTNAPSNKPHKKQKYTRKKVNNKFQKKSSSKPLNNELDSRLGCQAFANTARFFCSQRAAARYASKCRRAFPTPPSTNSFNICTYVCKLIHTNMFSFINVPLVFHQFFGFLFICDLINLWSFCLLCFCCCAISLNTQLFNIIGVSLRLMSAFVMFNCKWSIV